MTAEPRALPDEVVVAIANAAPAAGDLLVADDMDAAIEYAKACDVALRTAILDALDAERGAAEARGRAAALVEVDAAVERIGDHGDVTLRAEGGGWTLFQDRDVIEGRTTPTAAILAAARALDEGEGVGDAR